MAIALAPPSLNFHHLKSWVYQNSTHCSDWIRENGTHCSDWIRKNSTHCSDWVIEKSTRYSDVVFSIKILALNTLLLGGLYFKQVPRQIPNGILVVLSYSGIEWLPYPLHLLVKVSKDAVLATQAHMYLVAAISYAKAIDTLLDISLTIGGFSAALLGLAGYAALQTALYSFMMPIGLISLAGKFILLLAYIELKRRAIKQVESSSEFKLTPLVRAALDKDNSLDQLAKAGKTEIRAEVLKILKHQFSHATKVDLVMQVAGYVCLAVQKFFPANSITNAAINEAYSIGWLAKLIYEKIQLAHQRQAISTASGS